MKKIATVLLALATFCAISCNKVQKMDVTFDGNTYVNDYSGLVSAVNDLKKSIESRFDALNTIISQGLAALKVSVDENTKAIKVINVSTDEAFKSLNATILQGLTAISSQLDATGNGIIAAINQNGELISLKIDQNGNLIGSAIYLTEESLNATIKAGNESIAAKLVLIQSALTTGLYNIQQAELAVKTAIENITVSVDFTTLINAINSAFSEQGLKLTAIQQALAANGNKLSDIITALTTISTTQAAGYQSIVDMLEKMAYDNGVYIPKGTTDKTDPNYDPATDPNYNVYFNQYTWKNIEQGYESDKNIPDTTKWSDEAKTYLSVKEKLITYTATIIGSQYVSQYSQHAHADFAKVAEEDPILISSEVVYEGQDLVRVIKAAGGIMYTVRVWYTGCNTRNVYKVAVWDAQAVLLAEEGKTTGMEQGTFYRPAAETADPMYSQLDIKTAYSDNEQRWYRTDWTGNSGINKWTFKATKIEGGVKVVDPDQLDYTKITKDDVIPGVNVPIHLQTYYQDPTSGKSKIVDKIYFKAYCN